MAGLLDTVVQGILLGGMYALFALGQALLFGVMRLTNTAHGDFIVLGAFAASSLAPALVLGVAVGLTVALELLFDRTALGRAFRAVSDDLEAAQLMGLDHRRVYSVATGIAFALVAVAGTLHGMRTTFAAADGPSLLLYAFEAVIGGGMGSFYGTLAGGMLLGGTPDIGFRIDPGGGSWAGP